MELGIAIAVVFVAQFVKGATGFGSALIAMPPLAVLLGPAQAVLVTTICDTLASFGLMVSVREEVRWRMIWSMALPALIGVQLGTTLLGILPREALLSVLGLVVASLGADALVRPVRTGWGEHDDLPADGGRLLVEAAIAGFGSGLMGGAVGATGPPLVLWARRRLTDRFLRVQLIAALGLVGFSLPITLLARGFVEAGALWMVPWLLPWVALGSVLGARVAPHLSRVMFGRLVGALLVVAGGSLLARALYEAVG